MVLSQDILIYHNRPFYKYRWVSYYCGIYTAIVTVGLFLEPLGSKRDTKKQENSGQQVNHQDHNAVEMPQPTVVTFSNTVDSFKNTFSIKNIYHNLKKDPLVTSIQLFGSLLIPAISFYYVKSMVHEITLVPYGKARLATFSPFPFSRPKYKEVSIADISCVTSRHSNSNYAVLKIKDFAGYHLIQKTEGVVEQPELFDRYLGYERAWPRTKRSLLERLGLRK